jgi:hypothetical protein
MKKVLSTIGQFLLFALVFLAGSLFNPLHIRWFVTHPSPTSTRFFVPDGLLFMVVLYLVIVLGQALRKRLTAAAPWTTAGFLLALLAGYVAKFGFATHDMF